MKKLLLIFPALLCLRSAFSQEISCKAEIRPYVEFLNQPHQTPVDYVLSLFDRYDIVVLGERMHSEMTQYDLIEEILASPEFARKVGHVMTEIGSNNYTEAMNRVVSGKYNEARFRKELINVLRDCDEQVYWMPTNFSRLMTDIYHINRRLPRAQRIDITLLNPAWIWPEAGTYTAEEYAAFVHSISRYRYDISMAENAINAIYKIRSGADPRKKVLIIANRPHSYSTLYENKTKIDVGDNTLTHRIATRFPKQMANVKINGVVYRYPELDKKPIPSAEEYNDPTMEGKWDAAFELTGNRAVGFDLAGTPFGKDFFDEYEYWKGHPITY